MFRTIGFSEMKYTEIVPLVEHLEKLNSGMEKVDKESTRKNWKANQVEGKTAKCKYSDDCKNIPNIYKWKNKPFNYSYEHYKSFKTDGQKKKDLGSNMARIKELRKSQEDISIVIPSGTTMKEAAGKVRSAVAITIGKKETVRCQVKKCGNVPQMNKKKNEPFKICKMHYFTFMELNNRKDHIKGMHKSNRNPCKYCHDEAVQQRNLKNRIEGIHKSVRYPCNNCNDEAVQKSDLKDRSEGIHKGVRYPCNNGNDKGVQKSILKNRIEGTHEGVRYSCNDCNDEAMQQSGLKNRIERTHDGVRYSCNNRNDNASQRGNLMNRIEGAHEDFCYPCNECTDEAVRRNNQKKHIEELYVGVTYNYHRTSLEDVNINVIEEDSIKGQKMMVAAEDRKPSKSDSKDETKEIIEERQVKGQDDTIAVKKKRKTIE